MRSNCLIFDNICKQKCCFLFQAVLYYPWNKSSKGALPSMAEHIGITVNFTAEQQKFLDSAADGRDVLVDACIGSGKTTAIQAACGVLAGKNKKVLYLTYNRRLLEEARRRIDPHDADVHTFHSFGGGAVNAAGLYAGSERDVPGAFLGVNMLPKYDTVIVDEYQDLSEDLKDMLWHIVRLTVNNYKFAPQFLIVGDRDQKIMDNTEIDAPAEVRELMAFLAHVHKKPFLEMQFTNCFRLDGAYAAEIGQAWGKTIVGMNTDCRHGRMDLTKTALFLANCEPRDILVLGSNMSWGNRVKLQNMLEARWPEKFNKETVYSSITDRDGNRRGLDTSECAVFTTFDSAKGMERNVCVICDFTYKYLDARLKHQTSRDVLKNLFLVAASRGKYMNIMLADSDREVLDMKRIGSISGQPNIDMRLEYISELFDFKRKEAVDRCLALVDVEQIQPAGNAIAVTPCSGQIDLSPCAGIYAQAVFFRDYDIDGLIRTTWAEKAGMGDVVKLPEFKAAWPLWRKVLYLVAMQTGQERYFKQVREPYMTDDASEFLCNRLGERLHELDATELGCTCMFRPTMDRQTGRRMGDKLFRGRMDVVRDGTPWELKFVNELKAEHVLQTAMYAVCSNSEDGVLWNLRTDELLDVTVPDKSAFLEAVLSCVTNGRLAADGAFVNAFLDTGLGDNVRIDMPMAG